MPDVSTAHDGTDTYRVVTTDDETHRFRITGDESAREGYEYDGDGDPPETAVEALEGWIRQHHDSEQGGQDAGTDGSAEE